MVTHEPLRALPMHGPALGSTGEISRRLGAQARALESIAAQTLKALNDGTHKHDVANGIALPADLATSPDAAELYVTPR